MARKILLADDSVTAQNMGRKILADAGYDVLTVNNGSAALKRVAESAPDLIILDVYMPGYSGLEVCQRLKDAAETAHIPILLSVGKLEPFKPQEARRVRADAHIVKPFEASQLLTAIARLEDQMVPQQPKGRFATSGAAASMDDPFTRPDESRILGRGPKFSKKNKDASQSERVDPSIGGGDGQLSPQAASFRDFRKKAKSQAPASSPADYSSDSVAEPAPHEPGPLAKLPGDITAEELSALSEVAAKLNETNPAAQTTTSAATPVSSSAGIADSQLTDSQLEHEVANLPVVEAPVSAPPVSVAAETAVATTAPEVHATESPESIESPRSVVTSEAASEVAPEVAAEEVSAVAKSEIEIPVAQLEPTNNNEVAASGQFSQVESRVEPQPAESQQDFQATSVHVSDAVSTASFAQEPAPIDPQDEPMFASARAVQAYADEIASTAANYGSASATAASEQSSQNVSGEEHDKKQEFASIDSSFAQTAFAQSTSAESASSESGLSGSGSSESSSSESVSAESSLAQAPTTQSAVLESKSAESISAESPSEPTPIEVQASEAISPEAVTAPAAEAAEPEVPMPTDAELAEALRLLTPATAPAEPAAQSAETVPASRQWSDEETMELSAGKRWVAEALELTPEESAMSLEAEMFRSFAASAEKIESLPAENPLAAIQMAVENRLAAEAAAAAESESSREASLKTMAAAAPAGVASASSAETEIASIVEKVMADLRPRIVEEIARKLAGK
ncbi:MAG: response regulator [Terriglobales bacterium]